MSFYAEIYGYITVKEGENLSSTLIEEISIAVPIFKPCFSNPVKGRNTRYISFACSVKIDAGEESLWLTPFESLLKKTDFLNAAVHIEHEATPTMMMYSYLNNQGIQKISSKLIEQCLENIVISD